MKTQNILCSAIILISLLSCNQKTETKNSKAQRNLVKESTIDYQMLVQRATQTAIWAMPAVGMIDFVKATRRDVGGDYNDVIYLSKPFES
ncbi:MAG: hypothetical protein IZT56_07825, partial [Bacteroidetes bacterium]|nr:hypothetical protein [Bacteroidota bacterium]